MSTQAQTQVTAQQDSNMLKTVILADAIYCDIVGVGLLLFNGRIGEWVGLPPVAVAITGGLLMAWALALFIFGRRDPMPGWLPPLVIGGNIVWVVFTVVALLGGFLPLTTAGVWALIIIGDIVGVFAVLQIIALRRAAA